MGSASVLGRRTRNERQAPWSPIPPHPRGGWGPRWARAGLVLAALALVTLSLAGCLPSNGPPQGTLLQALALQIQLTQADVARALDLDHVGQPLVSRVRVERQDPVTIGSNSGLRLTGRFDWRLGKDPYRVDAPFEIFLERGSRGESWRLARPDGSAPEGTQDWLTYPLPLRQGNSLLVPPPTGLAPVPTG
ncbi:MAG: hypothetical protein ACK5QW_04655 [Cyanobacteriota bacterium]